ncbi:MAG TPA: sigma factor [Gemmatimonadaceae bacterium]
MTREAHAGGARASVVGLEELAKRAVAGDGGALTAVVEGVQDDVYRLALRMLWHPQDAEDASQEILFKIVTSLATFRGESAFRTWALRVATNHLLNVRRSCATSCGRIVNC